MACGAWEFLSAPTLPWCNRGMQWCAGGLHRYKTRERHYKIRLHHYKTREHHNKIPVHMCTAELHHCNLPAHHCNPPLHPYKTEMYRCNFPAHLCTGAVHHRKTPAHLCNPAVHRCKIRMYRCKTQFHQAVGALRRCIDGGFRLIRASCCGRKREAELGGLRRRFSGSYHVSAIVKDRAWSRPVAGDGARGLKGRVFVSPGQRPGKAIAPGLPSLRRSNPPPAPAPSLRDTEAAVRPPRRPARRG